MLEDLNELRSSALTKLKDVEDETLLEAWRTEFLGRKGALTTLLRQIGTIPAVDRPRVGQVANEIKELLERSYYEKWEALKTRALVGAILRDRIDTTLPGRRPALGQRHIVNKVMRDILDIFTAMGFQVAEGPEVEWDRYNFELLNIPPHHPARDMWDTFYVISESRPGQIVLRTHTSPVQIRVMEKTQPPIRVVVPGKCYRYEATDATHESMMHQVEGLAVDEHITFADLKGVLTAFVQQIFGPSRKVRFRCDYFPFVEPGAEMAIDCHICGGSGCRLCGQSGWIEILGAGMVHPKVLAGVGYDIDRYSGFAFGMGVERIAMLKYGIDDIRLFYANDLRFLRQFR